MQQKFKRGVFVVLVSVMLTILTMGMGLAADNLKEVKWGVIAPLTGSIAPIGINCQRGAMLAAEYINKAGGIRSLGGAKIKLVFADDEAKPDVGMAETEKLIQREKVTALIGAYTSSVTMPVTQVAEKYQIPVIVPTSAKDEITERGFKYTFRLCGKASAIAKEQYTFLQFAEKNANVKVKTIALLYEDSGWGQSWAKNVKELFPQMGYTIVADLPYSAQTKDIRSTILRLKAANPDVVLQESYTMDAILITKTMAELQYYAKLIIGTGTGHSNIDYHTATGNLKDTMLQWEGWNVAIPLQEIREVNKDFMKRYGIPLDVYAAWWYSCTYALAYATEAAGTDDPQKVRDELAKVNMPAGSKGNLNFFPLKFDEQGQVAQVSVHTQWINGKLEIVHPEVAATHKPVFPVPQWKDRMK